MIESCDPATPFERKGAQALTTAGFVDDGLTAPEVAARMAAGRVNGPLPRTSGSVHSIIRANALTRFNMLLISPTVWRPLRSTNTSTGKGSNRNEDTVESELIRRTRRR